MLCFICIGVMRMHQVTDLQNDDQHMLQKDYTSSLGYVGEIIRPLTQSNKSTRLMIDFLYLRAQNDFESAQGRTIVYLDTSKSKDLKVGDIVYISGSPRRIERPKNPFQFDYRQYLARRGVHFQQFANEINPIAEHDNHSIWVLTATLKNKASDVFTQTIPNDKVRSILNALILGDKEGVEEEVSDHFAAAGVMHILAVSGLHVGLIYLVFSWCFKVLPYALRKHQWLEAVLAITLLISYAFLTGLSPSVMRAVTMFSFIAIGSATGRSINIYNALAASALLLLIIDPHLIYSVGFQLSYLAVFGIVFLQPKLYALLQPRYWLFNKAWALVCVSIAAQLATAPLSIFYFNQFPSYFLIANLFIIPASFVMLTGGLFLLLMSFSEFLSLLFGKCLSFFVEWTYQFISALSTLPFGQLTGIKLSPLETLLLYGVLIFVVLTFTQKNPRLIIIGLLLSLFFAWSQLLDRSHSLSEKEVLVYDLPNTAAIHFRAANKGYLYVGDTIEKSNENLSYAIQPYVLFHRMPSSLDGHNLPVAQHAFLGGQIFVFAGKKILFLSENALPEHIPLRTEWDICITDDTGHMETIKANEFVLTSRQYQQLGQLENTAYRIADSGFYAKTWD
jgi:competence protein ComEC